MVETRCGIMIDSPCGGPRALLNLSVQGMNERDMF